MRTQKVVVSDEVRRTGDVFADEYLVCTVREFRQAVLI